MKILRRPLLFIEGLNNAEQVGMEALIPTLLQLTASYPKDRGLVKKTR